LPHTKSRFPPWAVTSHHEGTSWRSWFFIRRFTVDLLVTSNPNSVIDPQLNDLKNTLLVSQDVGRNMYRGQRNRPELAGDLIDKLKKVPQSSPPAPSQRPLAPYTTTPSPHSQSATMSSDSHQALIQFTGHRHLTTRLLLSLPAARSAYRKSAPPRPTRALHGTKQTSSGFSMPSQMARKFSSA
jgi:hypothetical protein